MAKMLIVVQVQPITHDQPTSVIVIDHDRVILWSENNVSNITRAFFELRKNHALIVIPDVNLIMTAEQVLLADGLPDHHTASYEVAQRVRDRFLK